MRARPTCVVNNGYLTLTSGGETGYSSGVFTFGAGGAIDIYGAIPALGINSPTLLLSALFTESLSAFGTVGTFAGSLNLASIFLNPAIGTFTYTGGAADTITIDLLGNCGSGTGSCKGLITQASASLQTTPEPTSLVFTGTGFLALAGVLRRRFWS